MVTHRLPCFSYNFYLLANSTCWPLSLLPFFLFFTGQLNVLAYLIFLLANSTCWPISFFLLANSTCWPFIMQPDGSYRLLLVAFPHARKIFLEVLAIDGYRKLDTVQFFKHVRISRQDLINLVQPMPSWRPLIIVPIFNSQW